MEKNIKIKNLVKKFFRCFLFKYIVYKEVMLVLFNIDEISFDKVVGMFRVYEMELG